MHAFASSCHITIGSEPLKTTSAVGSADERDGSTGGRHFCHFLLSVLACTPQITHLDHKAVKKPLLSIMLWKSNSNRFAFFYHKCDLCDWFQLGVESENSIGKAKKLDPSAEYIDAINELKGSLKKKPQDVRHVGSNHDYQARKALQKLFNLYEAKHGSIYEQKPHIMEPLLFCNCCNLSHRVWCQLSTQQRIVAEFANTPHEAVVIAAITPRAWYLCSWQKNYSRSRSESDKKMRSPPFQI